MGEILKFLTMNLGGSAVMMGKDGACSRPEDGWCSGHKKV